MKAYFTLLVCGGFEGKIVAQHGVLEEAQGLFLLSWLLNFILQIVRKRRQLHIVVGS